MRMRMTGDVKKLYLILYHQSIIRVLVSTQYPKTNRVHISCDDSDDDDKKQI